MPRPGVHARVSPGDLEWRSAFEERGLFVVDGVLGSEATSHLATLAEPLFHAGATSRPGVRRVCQQSPSIVDVVAHSPVLPLLRSLAGPTARIVRSILFDKTPETNWLVPWHQDALIAVAERRDVPGFGPWSIKEGEPHCRPPIEVLESLVTIRIHLDACPADAGPLRGVIGSHRLGVLRDDAVEAEALRAASEGRILEATTGLGGVVVMSPLTIHSSPKATRTIGRRRVLHLDCSAMELPDGLAWGERVALD